MKKLDNNAVESISDDSSDISNIRKCDGSAPCSRCKSDDTICAYGNQKKTDKIIFRKGYVQMLERQHAQLIAGLQELYRRTQDGQGWRGTPLDLVNNGQPLTHQMLERLGVLRSYEWDDSECLDDMPPWQSFEQRSQEEHGMIHDPARTTSPILTPAVSPTSQSAFPHSAIMAKRRSKQEPSKTPISPTLLMTPMVSWTHPYDDDYQPLPYNTDLDSSFESSQHDPELPLHLPTPMEALNHWIAESDNLPFGNTDWAFGTADKFETTGNPSGLALQASGQ